MINPRHRASDPPGPQTFMENRGIDAIGEARKTYSQEKLVAEMGAAFLAAHAGIVEDGFENSAAYLSGWLSVLQVSDHKTWLVKAASEAEKAADYILGIESEAASVSPENAPQVAIAAQAGTAK